MSFSIPPSEPSKIEGIIDVLNRVNKKSASEDGHLYVKISNKGMEAVTKTDGYSSIAQIDEYVRECLRALPRVSENDVKSKLDNLKNLLNQFHVSSYEKLGIIGKIQYLFRVSFTPKQAGSKLVEKATEKNLKGISELKGKSSAQIGLIVQSLGTNPTRLHQNFIEDDQSGGSESDEDSWNSSELDFSYNPPSSEILEEESLDRSSGREFRLRSRTRSGSGSSSISSVDSNRFRKEEYGYKEYRKVIGLLLLKEVEECLSIPFAMEPSLIRNEIITEIQNSKQITPNENLTLEGLKLQSSDIEDFDPERGFSKDQLKSLTDAKGISELVKNARRRNISHFLISEGKFQLASDVAKTITDPEIKVLTLLGVCEKWSEGAEYKTLMGAALEFEKIDLLSLDNEVLDYYERVENNFSKLFQEFDARIRQELFSIIQEGRLEDALLIIKGVHEDAIKDTLFKEVCKKAIKLNQFGPAFQAFFQISIPDFDLEKSLFEGLKTALKSSLAIASFESLIKELGELTRMLQKDSQVAFFSDFSTVLLAEPSSGAASEKNVQFLMKEVKRLVQGEGVAHLVEAIARNLLKLGKLSLAMSVALQLESGDIRESLMYEIDPKGMEGIREKEVLALLRESNFEVIAKSIQEKPKEFKVRVLSLLFNKVEFDCRNLVKTGELEDAIAKAKELIASFPKDTSLVPRLASALIEEQYEIGFLNEDLILDSLSGNFLEQRDSSKDKINLIIEVAKRLFSKGKLSAAITLVQKLPNGKERVELECWFKELTRQSAVGPLKYPLDMNLKGRISILVAEGSRQAVAVACDLINGNSEISLEDKKSLSSFMVEKLLQKESVDLAIYVDRMLPDRESTLNIMRHLLDSLDVEKALEVANNYGDLLGKVELKLFVCSELMSKGFLRRAEMLLNAFSEEEKQVEGFSSFKEAILVQRAEKVNAEKLIKAAKDLFNLGQEEVSLDLVLKIKGDSKVLERQQKLVLRYFSELLKQGRRDDALCAVEKALKSFEGGKRRSFLIDVSKLVWGEKDWASFRYLELLSKEKGWLDTCIGNADGYRREYDQWLKDSTSLVQEAFSQSISDSPDIEYIQGLLKDGGPERNAAGRILVTRFLESKNIEASISILGTMSKGRIRSLVQEEILVATIRLLSKSKGQAFFEDAKEFINKASVNPDFQIALAQRLACTVIWKLKHEQPPKEFSRDELLPLWVGGVDDNFILGVCSKLVKSGFPDLLEPLVGGLKNSSLKSLFEGEIPPPNKLEEEDIEPAIELNVGDFPKKEDIQDRVFELVANYQNNKSGLKEALKCIGDLPDIKDRTALKNRIIFDLIEMDAIDEAVLVARDHEDKNEQMASLFSICRRLTSRGLREKALEVFYSFDKDYEELEGFGDYRGGLLDPLEEVSSILIFGKMIEAGEDPIESFRLLLKKSKVSKEDIESCRHGAIRFLENKNRLVEVELLAVEGVLEGNPRLLALLDRCVKIMEEDGDLESNLEQAEALFDKVDSEISYIKKLPVEKDLEEVVRKRDEVYAKLQKAFNRLDYPKIEEIERLIEESLSSNLDSILNQTKEIYSKDERGKLYTNICERLLAAGQIIEFQTVITFLAREKDTLTFALGLSDLILGVNDGLKAQSSYFMTLVAQMAGEGRFDEVIQIARHVALQRLNEEGGVWTQQVKDDTLIRFATVLLENRASSDCLKQVLWFIRAPIRDDFFKDMSRELKKDKKWKELIVLAGSWIHVSFRDDTNKQYQESIKLAYALLNILQKEPDFDSKIDDVLKNLLLEGVDENAFMSEIIDKCQPRDLFGERLQKKVDEDSARVGKVFRVIDKPNFSLEEALSNAKDVRGLILQTEALKDIIDALCDNGRLEECFGMLSTKLPFEALATQREDLQERIYEKVQELCVGLLDKEDGIALATQKAKSLFTLWPLKKEEKQAFFVHITADMLVRQLELDKIRSTGDADQIIVSMASILSLQPWNLANQILANKDSKPFLKDWVSNWQKNNLLPTEVILKEMDHVLLKLPEGLSCKELFSVRPKNDEKQVNQKEIDSFLLEPNFSELKTVDMLQLASRLVREGRIEDTLHLLNTVPSDKDSLLHLIIKEEWFFDVLTELVIIKDQKIFSSLIALIWETPCVDKKDLLVRIFKEVSLLSMDPSLKVSFLDLILEKIIDKRQSDILKDVFALFPKDNLKRWVEKFIQEKSIKESSQQIRCVAEVVISLLFEDKVYCQKLIDELRRKAKELRDQSNK